MKAVGLDLGQRTLGVAISDALGWYAHPVSVIRFADDDYEDALMQLLPVLEEQKAEIVVLGLPKHMNGDIGIRGEICLDFGRRIEEETGLSVVMWDERLTTMAAEKTLIAFDVSRAKRKKIIDRQAAVVILQGYLDSKR